MLSISLCWVSHDVKKVIISFQHGAGYTSMSLIILSSKWGRSMWLLWHTKKSFNNILSSTSSSEACLGEEEEPEFVAFWEDQSLIQGEGPIWHLWPAQGWAQKRNSWNLPKILCNPNVLYDEIYNKARNRVWNNIPGTGSPCIQAMALFSYIHEFISNLTKILNI